MTDTIEDGKVAASIVGMPGTLLSQASLDKLTADIEAYAQAAIASHTKALIEQAGELEKRLEDHARAVGGDDSFDRLYGSEAVQAAATIAALRAEIERAKEEGVRAGIEAAAVRARTLHLFPAPTSKAARYHQRVTQDAMHDAIRALDPAAIAKGV